MTPEQLESWPAQQLRDALAEFADDYDEAARASIAAELDRRGLAHTRAVGKRSGVEGFADSFAASGGSRAGSTLLVGLACCAVGAFGAWRFLERLQNPTAASTRAAWLALGLVVGVPLVLQAAFERGRRA
ncbi:MAG: hypothetical protein R3F62_10400 [Planctomycetota bacterium]